MQIPALTDAEHIRFEADGFLTLPGALSRDHLAQVQAAARRAENTWRSDLTRPGARSAALEQVQAPIEYEPELLDLLWYPPVFARVRAVRAT